jgi:probable phosphoglycerate mutase
MRRFAGRTDIALSPEGERNALALGGRLKEIAFDKVFVSPLARARRTAELAGAADKAVIDERLAEWNFGEYEGKLREEVCRIRPGWTYLKDGCPSGETAADIAGRADSFIADLKKLEGTVLLVAHSVLLRVLASRWVGLPPEFARHLALGPASVSILGDDPVEDAPVIRVWNDMSHLEQVR